MSSLPGLRLEDFLQWNYDLVVLDDARDANPSLGMAEFLGTRAMRPRLTEEEFAPILDLFEPFREEVERGLADFDEETQSWRDYSCVCGDRVPLNVYAEALDLIQELLAKKGATT